MKWVGTPIVAIFLVPVLVVASIYGCRHFNSSNYRQRLESYGQVTVIKKSSNVVYSGLLPTPCFEWVKFKPETGGELVVKNVVQDTSIDDGDMAVLDCDLDRNAIMKPLNKTVLGAK